MTEMAARKAALCDPLMMMMIENQIHVQTEIGHGHLIGQATGEDLAQGQEVIDQGLEIEEDQEIGIEDREKGGQGHKNDGHEIGGQEKDQEIKVQ